MKKHLFIGGFILAASAGLSFGQGLTQGINNPRVALPAVQPSRGAPRPVAAARGGVIPTAVRHGNPLQMLNPRAPVRYGNSQQHITTDPHDPGKPTGVALFAWEF
jgi:hypothetical protein